MRWKDIALFNLTLVGLELVVIAAAFVQARWF